MSLLLAHYHSQEASVVQMRGSDAVLHSLLREAGGLQLSVIPVLLSVNKRGDDECRECSRPWTPSGIFPVTEEIIEGTLALAAQRQLARNQAFDLHGARSEAAL